MGCGDCFFAKHFVNNPPPGKDLLPEKAAKHYKVSMEIIARLMYLNRLELLVENERKCIAELAKMWDGADGAQEQGETETA